MKIKILVAMILILAISLFAVSQDRDDNKEEKKGEVNSEAVKERVKSLLKADFKLDSWPTYKRKIIFDFPKAMATISSENNSFKVQLMNPSNFKVPVINFSTTIHDPYAGSPAYDVIPGPRYSLNVDRVSGKYYWEW